jgi:hypothetical protein
VSNPLDVKKNDGNALDFALRLSPLFSVSENLDFPFTAIHSSPDAFLIILRVFVATFSENLTKYDAVPLSDL